MINCADFIKLLAESGIEFFCGVPDSLLKNFCSFLEDNIDKQKHIIAANEGNAIGISAGYYLSTGKIGLVYMQNSGLGNSVNPLTSLSDRAVYGIPTLILIGWRGRPGIKDEPQHIKAGKITLRLLKTLDIPFCILPKSLPTLRNKLMIACDIMAKDETPYAFVVREGTFAKYESKYDNGCSAQYELKRNDAIKIVIDCLSLDDVVVSTTGKTSRELFEYRQFTKLGHFRDFLTVGSMGHSSQIALGIAQGKPNKKVYCIDGDGAMIMHMGAMAVIGSEAPANLRHILINNGCHESVGGQLTAGYKIDFVSIAKSCGYKNALRATTKEEVGEKLSSIQNIDGPSFLEILVTKGSVKGLGRPNTSPSENKRMFMEFLRK